MSESLTPSVDMSPRKGRAGLSKLREAIVHSHAGRIAVVSSFGAESALLLALVAEIDRDVPVLFLDTFKSFPETRRIVTGWWATSDCVTSVRSRPTPRNRVIRRARRPA